MRCGGPPAALAIPFEFPGRVQAAECLSEKSLDGIFITQVSTRLLGEWVPTFAGDDEYVLRIDKLIPYKEKNRVPWTRHPGASYPP